jgi:hypothetical protein
MGHARRLNVRRMVIAATAAVATSCAVLTTSPSEASTPVRASYDVYFGGLHMAVAEATVNLTGEQYSLSMVSTLRGLSGVFSNWRAEASAQGAINGTGVFPSRHRFMQMRRGGTETVEMQFGSNRVPNRTFTPSRDIPEPDHPDFVPESDLESVLDPVSGVIAAMNAVSRTDTCRATMPVYDGRRRYDMVFTPVGMETLDRSRYTSFSGPATRCRVHLELVSGAFQSADSDQFWSRGADRSDRQMDVWFAQAVPGGPVVPVRMQGDTRFGRFVIHLRNAVPIGQ